MTDGAASVAALRGKLERYLEELYGAVQTDPDGDFLIGSGSAPVWIRPIELYGGRVGVRIWSITNVDLHMNDELTRFLVTENGRLVFGGLSLSEDGSRVSLGHTLLGEFLNRKELEAAVAGVGLAADHYDDVIKERFGGRLSGEPG